jgi:hemolysin activation/secretion protein
MYAPGRLTLQGEKLSRDVISGLNASGGFNKWNLDIARIQATPLTGLSLFGRYSGQQASKNLDSSEKFGLGGPKEFERTQLGLYLVILVG